MSQIIPVPAYVTACCAVLREAGFSAHPVGGCVRDALLGRTPSDWDVTTSALPEQTLALFPRTVPTGLRHGTVTVLTDTAPIEVTTFRRESGYSDGRRPDAVAFVPSLEEDLARRDFTVNAMALAPDGSVIDLFGGLADLQSRTLRCVGDPAQRFGEDRLRMLRALRFAAQLDFTLHPSVQHTLEARTLSTGALAAERVRIEVEKALLSPRPQWVGEMVRLGLLEPWLGHHRPADLTRLSSLPALPLPRWAGLIAALRAPHLPAALRLEGRLARALEEGFALYESGLPADDAGWRRALARFGLPAGEAAAFMGGQDISSILASRPCLSVNELALSGGELAAMGLRGSEIGSAQRRLLSFVLDHPECNTKQALLSLLKN